MFEVVVEDVMRKRSFRFAVIAIGLAVTLAGSAAAQTQPPTTQVPQPPANDVNWPGAGYGVGSLLCNVLYIPAKLTYAVLGGVVGGGTYLVTGGNQTAANTVWRSSLGGDYVVTPQMLAGSSRSISAGQPIRRPMCRQRPTALRSARFRPRRQAPAVSRR